MYSHPNAASLAARIRSLVGPTDRDSLGRIAYDLGVHDSELREILEYHTPYPSPSLLAAIVAAYGVDAGWLLTGEYSPSAHRADEEADEPPKSRVGRLLDDVRSLGPPR